VCGHDGLPDAGVVCVQRGVVGLVGDGLERGRDHSEGDVVHAGEVVDDFGAAKHVDWLEALEEGYAVGFEMRLGLAGNSFGVCIGRLGKVLLHLEEERKEKKRKKKSFGARPMIVVEHTTIGYIFIH
jgi:hypothetical protein